ncbi:MULTISPECIES: hypothetical protein [Streptomyces]|uniref:hypothetical protein n=1 Tax=Streptomyces TaxID=1883 RepID=UPI001E5AB7C2|nr:MULTISPECIES: hypothetical protein [Streptomyces]UFQ13570.1 hypothetical protein J2N69_00210 [Streptomyces huasconensis]WCL83167.1 hypothetical protein PPN52_00205 [Streptomyces sp. JCM 35825]
MSEQTPSQAEGEREQDTPTEQSASDTSETPRTTPSQTEGEDTEEESRDAPEQD